MCDKYMRILHTWDRMERFTKSELGAKNVKFVDRPEFGLMFAQLDIEASLIGQFHSNPPSSFWGVFWYLHN